MIGIYKITSPSGKIYIGQSVDIEKRWKFYFQPKGLDNQPKLENSFLKHNVDSHIFEIIEECEFEQLNIRERHWQDFYDVLNKGLNCILTNTNILPQIQSIEMRNKRSVSMSGDKNPNFRKQYTEQEKNRRSISMLGKNLGNNNGMYNIKGELHPSYGKFKSEQFKKDRSEEKKGSKHNRAKLVLCKETGIFYYCVIEAAEAFNINKVTLRAWLSGRSKNKTNLIYV